MNNNRLKISEPNLSFIQIVLWYYVTVSCKSCEFVSLPRYRFAAVGMSAWSRLARVSRWDPRPRRSSRFRQCRNPNGGWIDWSFDPSVQFLVAVISSPYFYSVRFSIVCRGFSWHWWQEILFIKAITQKLFGDYDDFIIISSCKSHARQHF